MATSIDNMTKYYYPTVAQLQSSGLIDQVYTIFEEPAHYHVTPQKAPTHEELIEQCQALVHAMIETTKPDIRESLLFILEEKLQQL